MAHGYTIAKSLTLNLNTGKVYSLAELFKPGSDYIKTLSSIVDQQIKQRKLPTLNGFQTIQPDQDFYLAYKSLVLYFQLYQITPYYVGLPMFPISIYDLQSITEDTSPLAALSADFA
ncbi:RsiV family protein [Ferviditalea candida]|uniref:RsiV family protein n=1 Tax=Ferviditalea candida TaxID=3108399 RepID=A0ABU5ZN11_9BACL|nr:RsiV family protein [Paenibacillaceae bacterium T2]